MGKYKYTPTDNPHTQDKDRSDPEKRKEESAKVLKKYNDRYPVIVYSSSDKFDFSSTTNNDGKKKYGKFLAPGDLSIAQFTQYVRKRITLDKEQALWLFVYKDKQMVIPPTSQSMVGLYNEYKSEDGFLYIDIQLENVFG